MTKERQKEAVQKRPEWPSFFEIDSKSWPSDLESPQIRSNQYWKPKINGGRGQYQTMDKIQPRHLEKWITNFNNEAKPFITSATIFIPTSDFPIKEIPSQKPEKEDETEKRKFNLQATQYIIQTTLSKGKKYQENLDKARNFYKTHPNLHRDFTSELLSVCTRYKPQLIQSLKTLKQELKNYKN